MELEKTVFQTVLVHREYIQVRHFMCMFLRPGIRRLMDLYILIARDDSLLSEVRSWLQAYQVF